MKKNYFLKLPLRSFLLMTMLMFFHSVHAQKPPSLPDTSKMTYNQISNGLKLYVFPAKGQSKQQQKEDEFECYKWVMEQGVGDTKQLKH